MTNNGLQFLSVKADAPPDTLEIYTRDARKRLVRKKEVPQKGAGGAILVRMPSDAGPDEVFFVKLVYSTRGELPGAVFHGLAFRAPAVEGGAVPILGTSWYVYPPAGTTITRTGGSLTWYDEPDSWLTAVGRAFSDILPGHTSTVVVSRDGKQLAIPAEIEDLAPRNQSALRFGGRVQNPTVEVTFASPGAFTAIRVLVLLLVLAFGVLALGRRSGRVRSLFVFGCVALPLLLAPVAAVGTAKVLSAVLFGGVLAGATLLARDISTGIAARRRAAALIAASAPADAEEE
jgi:hypothetical protein